MPKNIELTVRWQGGDEAAAQALFEQYAARLIALVRVHLAEKLAQRFDPEDVVQSAFRSFFVGTREGRYLLRHSGDLWKLLVAITRHKLQHQVARHRASKRDVNREEAVGIDARWFDEFQDRLACSPPIGDAIVLAEEIETLLALLDRTERRMFELRLEGYTLDEIADDADRSQRTVRRVMDRIKAELVRRKQEYAVA